MALRDEIGEQPEVAARLLGEGSAQVGRLAEEVRSRRIAFALIAARGTSDHAAVYAQYALGVQAELAVALATLSVISRYGARPG